MRGSRRTSSTSSGQIRKTKWITGLWSWCSLERIRIECDFPITIRISSSRSGENIPSGFTSNWSKNLYWRLIQMRCSQLQNWTTLCISEPEIERLLSLCKCIPLWICHQRWEVETFVSLQNCIHLLYFAQLEIVKFLSQQKLIPFKYSAAAEIKKYLSFRKCISIYIIWMSESLEPFVLILEL